ncbi:uncharacterized protein LY89DRAFT_784042 [Mollisia scopiformis]|uniref:Uncharacterized protein n=1 Tax=Mollisia scopiformis TaxID=149040 RepID=A0A194X4A7_MOLSC|nr:uncharacterized protein LY89DRAFT_784042 [Mollisia scopiformis]KUJ15006.1 hypothetical protein LY89DRAFT_784042 [Mollisia scopiformis]
MPSNWPTVSEKDQSTTSEIYEASEVNYEDRRETLPPQYSEYSMPMNSDLQKPVVIPQQTNIFMIKTFSPFARAYSPAFSTLPNPIPKDEFISFIDGLNKAFISSPIFQAAHVVGGGLLGSQILPAQAVGGVFQVVSVLGSAGVSVIRVRRYMKKANANIFAPRGLIVKIMSTKKMMTEVGCPTVDPKGKLALPPLEELSDLTPQTGALIRHPTGGTIHSRTGSSVEDPRMRRIRALGNYISPLEFETTLAQPKGMMDKYGGAPLRWMNKRADTKLVKAADKSASARLEKAPEAEVILNSAERKLESISSRMAEIHDTSLRERNRYPEDREKIEAVAERELASLEEKRNGVVEERDRKIKAIYEKGDKKLEKLAKKEEKIANRILWVVVQRLDGHVGDELLEVESRGSSPTS